MLFIDIGQNVECGMWYVLQGFGVSKPPLYRY